MLTFQRTVEVEGAREDVHAYLTDVRTVSQWQPRASAVTLVSGDGGPGTRYDYVLHGLGRHDPMQWTVWHRECPESLVRSGETSWLRAVETIVLRQEHCVTAVCCATSYDVRSWPPRLQRALLSRHLARWCDDAADGLEQSLTRHLQALRPSG